MIKVKICGIQTPEAATAAVEAGASYLGFVFAKSRRYVDPLKVKEIIENCVPEGIGCIGVFVNDPPDVVAAIAREAGLTHIQLHGQENPDDYRFIGLPIIKAVPVSAEGALQAELKGEADFYLLDTQTKGQFGGTGQPFDWSEELLKPFEKPCFVAGGLNPENIRSAVSILKPFAVDVSSGVETDGVKSPDKIHAFMKEVQQCPM